MPVTTVFSGFQTKVTFRHFLWLWFRMAWARNLLGFGLFACAPQAPFSPFLPDGLAFRCAKVFLPGGKFFSFFLMFFGHASYNCFFWIPKVTFRHFLWLRFRMAWARNLLGFGLFACAPQVPFSWVLPGGVQDSKSLVAQKFFLLEASFFLVFLVGSKGNVTAFVWLRIRSGLKPGRTICQAFMHDHMTRHSLGWFWIDTHSPSAHNWNPYTETCQ